MSDIAERLVRTALEDVSGHMLGEAADEIARLRTKLAEVEKRAALADEVNKQIRADLSRAERMVHTLSDKAATLNVDLVAARADLAAVLEKVKK